MKDMSMDAHWDRYLRSCKKNRVEPQNKDSWMTFHGYKESTNRITVDHSDTVVSTDDKPYNGRKASKR